MKGFLMSLGFVILFLGFFYSGWLLRGMSFQSEKVLSAVRTITPTPLVRYEIEKLSQANIEKSQIRIKETLSEEEKYTSFVFEHKFDPTLEDKDEKTVTGQINIPVGEEKYPLVIMIRGYVDQTIYETGVGTRSAAAFFANNGFITIAPDFLGYAGSSIESSNIFESRFQTYTTLLSILNSLNSIKEWDKENIFIWAHSNGGQIALTTLTVTGRTIPTTLWAPVTKPFPYSVLYYTDESFDGGKFIRSELSEFELLYDVEKFSFTNYLDKINAPIQLHQGGADDAIPVEWSDTFVKRLEAKEKDVTYFVYPSADHNLRPDWNTVVARDLEFFRKHLKSE